MLAGLVLLVLGGEFLVRGASSLASSMGISPLIVGLTVVSFATSAPELAVTLKAVGDGTPDMAIGNVVGSNIANVLLVLGTAAVIAPLVVRSRVVKQDIPVMIGFSVLLLIFALDLRISTVEAGILFGLLIIYAARAVIVSRRENAAGRLVPTQGPPIIPEPDAVRRGGPAAAAVDAPAPDDPTPDPSRGSLTDDLGGGPLDEPVEDLSHDPAYLGPPKEGEEPRIPALLAVVLVAAGVAMLVFGANLLVAGAKEIASALGVSDLVIGLTVVAVGTSLPELATTIIASMKGERDLAVGNAVGSNIFNIGAVVGLSGLVSGGLPVAESAVAFDIPLVILTGLLLLPLAFSELALTRGEGLLLLIAYGVYTAYLLLDAGNHAQLAALTSRLLWVAIPATAAVMFIGWWLSWRQKQREEAGAAASGTRSPSG